MAPEVVELSSHIQVHAVEGDTAVSALGLPRGECRPGQNIITRPFLRSHGMREQSLRQIKPPLPDGPMWSVDRCLVSYPGPADTWTHGRAGSTEGGPGEVHEDVGFLSRDKDRSSFVFKQFLTEAFVNTFDVSVEQGQRTTILFGARESESAGGMRVQMQLTFLSETEYAMVLQLAAPGNNFSPCQRMRMRKEG